MGGEEKKILLTRRKGLNKRGGIDWNPSNKRRGKKHKGTGTYGKKK